VEVEGERGGEEGGLSRLRRRGFGGQVECDRVEKRSFL
jgi:hypothetical protein